MPSATVHPTGRLSLTCTHADTSSPSRSVSRTHTYHRVVDRAIGEGIAGRALHTKHGHNLTRTALRDFLVNAAHAHTADGSDHPGNDCTCLCTKPIRTKTSGQGCEGGTSISSECMRTRRGTLTFLPDLVLKIMSPLRMVPTYAEEEG